MTVTAVPAAIPIRRAEPVMGTVVSFDIRPGEGADRDAAYLALADARALLHRADAVFSTWKPLSPVSRLRRGEIGLDDVPDVVRGVLDRCRLAEQMSGGWFDPWAMPGGVDPTGLVKGWAASLAADAIEAAGVAGVMVSAGGDVAVRGEPEPGRPWRIGIQNPFDRNTVVAVANPPGAIATSGAYERGLHVYDPHTGRPAEVVASATVTGPELDLVDALATGLLAGGPAALPAIEALTGFEAMLIGLDASVTTTAGFPRA